MENKNLAVLSIEEGVDEISDLMTNDHVMWSDWL